MTDLTPDQLQALMRGPRWGFFENGKFISVPKPPIILAGKQAPCAITLSDGRMREIVLEPQPASP